MNAKSFLNKVCEEIRYKPVRVGISEELEQHINDIKEDYMNRGFEENEAEEKAVLQMGDAEQIGKKLNKIHRPKLDWKLVLLVAVLIGFGIFSIFIKSNSIEGTYAGSIKNATIYIVLGAVLSLGVYLFDYKKIKKYSMLIYITSTIITILPIVGIGGTINGAYYIGFLGITFSSFTIAVPLYLISFIGFVVDYRKDNIKKIQFYSKEVKLNKDMIKIIILSSLSLLLMFFSLASIVILSCAYLTVLTIKIIKDKDNFAKKLLIMYGIIFGIIVFFTILGMINLSSRLDRVYYSLNPNADPSGKGYVQMLQRETIRKAKIIGEADNMSIPIDDSILNIEGNYTFIYLIGKCGWIIAVIIAITVVLASIRLIVNAKNIKEQYGKLLIIGLSSLFIVQSFATILMNISLGVQADVSLPFVTYGGTYFIVNIVNIAIILSVYRRKDIDKFSDKLETESI